MLFRAAHGVLYLPLYCAVKQHNGRAGLPEPLAVASAAAAAVTATACIELPLEALMLRVKSAGGTFGSAARAALTSPAGVAGLWAGAAPYGEFAAELSLLQTHPRTLRAVADAPRHPALQCCATCCTRLPSLWCTSTFAAVSCAAVTRRPTPRPLPWTRARQPASPQQLARWPRCCHTRWTACAWPPAWALAGRAHAPLPHTSCAQPALLASRAASRHVCCPRCRAPSSSSPFSRLRVHVSQARKLLPSMTAARIWETYLPTRPTRQPAQVLPPSASPYRRWRCESGALR